MRRKSNAKLLCVKVTSMIVERSASVEDLAMAPLREEPMQGEESCLAVNPGCDCNNNNSSGMETGSKRPSNSGDVNERSRKLIKSCFVTLTSNLNVLVVGSKNSGKNYVINIHYHVIDIH